MTTTYEPFIEVEDNAEWGSLDSQPNIFHGAGDIDGRGGEFTNDQPALILNDGYIVIEGTPDKWRALARAILNEFP